MTAEKFRTIALAIPGAIESSHMDHPDFRIGGKIFASLGYPDDAHGMAKLTPGQQWAVLKKEPGIFAPCAGSWGKHGMTAIHLASAKPGVVIAALHTAASNVMKKPIRPAQGWRGRTTR